MFTALSPDLDVTEAASVTDMLASDDNRAQQMPAGTYLGLVEKLDYLQALGINAIELLPVQEFNELEYYQVLLAYVVYAICSTEQPVI